jgi:hypothetical protein
VVGVDDLLALELQVRHSVPLYHGFALLRVLYPEV